MSRADMSITFKQLPAGAGGVKDQGAHRDIEVSLVATKRADDYDLPCGPPSSVHVTLRRRFFFPAGAGNNGDSAARSGLVLAAVYGTASDEAWQLDRDQREQWPLVEIVIRTQGGVTTTYRARGLTVLSYHVDHESGMETLELAAREIEQEIQNGASKSLRTSAAREAA